MARRKLGFFVLAATLCLGLVDCRPSVDPNRGRYACEADPECGSDFECKKQVAGGGLCFQKGSCSEETCNGKDDDCNGLVDETFPGVNTACTTGKPGVCAEGKRSCVDAVDACVSTVAPSVELCNGLDDDCNSSTDETFTLAIDSLNCGICGRACPSGTGCQRGECKETNCADGVDNDGDGGKDCADPSCQQRTCFTSEDAGYVCGKFPDPPDGGPDLDAGVDGGRFFCFPAEQCADGLDNDQDALTDCADPDCNERLCVSGTLCTNSVCPGPG